MAMTDYHSCTNEQLIEHLTHKTTGFCGIACALSMIASVKCKKKEYMHVEQK